MARPSLQARQNVFTIGLSTPSVDPIVAVNPVGGALNELCSLSKTTANLRGFTLSHPGEDTSVDAELRSACAIVW